MLTAAIQVGNMCWLGITVTATSEACLMANNQTVATVGTDLAPTLSATLVSLTVYTVQSWELSKTAEMRQKQEQIE